MYHKKGHLASGKRLLDHRSLWGLLRTLVNAAIAFKKPLSTKERLKWQAEFEQRAIRVGGFTNLNCLECGAKIPIERRRNHAETAFCCKRHLSRVQARRRYYRMRENDPEKYARRIASTTARAQKVRREDNKRCTTCGRPNDNYPYKRTCEACLQKCRMRNG